MFNIRSYVDQKKALARGITPGKYKKYVKTRDKEMYMRESQIKREEELRYMKEREKIRTDNKLNSIRQRTPIRQSVRNVGKQINERRKKLKSKNRAYRGMDPSGGSGPQLGLSRDIDFGVNKPKGPKFGL